MNPRRREIETLILTMVAAVPLYFTFAIGAVPLLLFHATMIAITIRVAMGKGADVIPLRVMRVLSGAYIAFYFVDWIGISHSAIAASTHLVLFIAVYQPIEAMVRNNHSQRLLTTGLIFVASISTSTHITIIVFVLLFAFLMFRQLMYVSHLETVSSIGREYAEPPSGRAALFYVAGAVVIGSILFPFLPRVRNPFVQGVTGGLPGATTALSETIDFRDPRVAPPDASVVARIWMDYPARPFFLPMRLRGNIYDRFRNGAWRQTQRGIRPLAMRDDGFFVARPAGIEHTVMIQERLDGGKLFVPVGTYRIDGLTSLYEGPARDVFFTYNRGILTFNARLAQKTEPLRVVRITPNGYPVTPQVAALAHSIVGNETRPERQAQLIEDWMLRNFHYVPNTEAPRAMTIERFLLRDRIGHCEYFAAGMAVLMTALGVPARIAGGYYGGRFNPLMGYFTIRRDDAHAWTEVWDGGRWLTFDATPPSLRPGTDSGGLIGAYASALGDSITYFWDRYVLTYGLGDQVALLTDLITSGRNTIVSIRASVERGVRELASRAFVVLLSLLIAITLGTLLYARRRRPLFDLLAARLAAHGVEVSPSMTVEEAMRVLRAHDAEEIAPLIALYEEAVFSGRADRKRSGARLRRALADSR